MNNSLVFLTEYMDLCCLVVFFFYWELCDINISEDKVLSFPPAFQGCFSIKFLIVSMRFTHCFKTASNN